MTITAIAEMKTVLPLIINYLKSELERLRTMQAGFREQEEIFFSGVEIDRDQKTKLTIDFSCIAKEIADRGKVVNQIEKDVSCLLKDLEQGIINESFRRLLHLAIIACTKLLVSKRGDDADETFLSLVSKIEDAAKKL